MMLVTRFFNWMILLAQRSANGTASKGTYTIITLGCPKNLVDSERMLGRLRLEGYEMVREPKGADFVVINTCGFLEVARQESLRTIREMVQLKKRGHIGGVIVSGCLAERDKESLLTQCPGIDQLVGLFSRDEIVKAADRILGGITEQRSVFYPAPTRPLSDANRLRITPPHLAYLKIAEGCNRLCTYCTIPRMRGPHASKPIDEVVAEAEQLAAEGTRELIIVAQDTTFYGIDLDGRPQLAELLTRLQAVQGVEWIRLMYLYPMYFTDELIDVLAGGGKILPYLDLPLQHINDKVLRQMNRRVTRHEIEQLIDRLRQRIEGLVLRTTFITGFPGETGEQFDELLAFVEARRFERLGAFAYSLEEDTPSARLPDRCPPEVGEARRGRVLEAQQKIAFGWNEAQIGRRLDVLVDRQVSEDPPAFVGRSYADAPEIDGAVYVTGEGLAPGQIVPCEIVATKEYDLIAAAVADPR
jgi:ribosomal protein S12 methylthiotransferase